MGGTVIEKDWWDPVADVNVTAWGAIGALLKPTGLPRTGLAGAICKAAVGGCPKVAEPGTGGVAI